MGAFDRSYHDILNKYKQIKEGVNDTQLTPDFLNLIRNMTSSDFQNLVNKQKATPAPVASAGTATPATAPVAPKGAVASTTSAPAAPAAQAGPATDAEKSLLKKFHASDYNPNSKADNARLQELRSAVAATGGDISKADPNKLRTLAYAQQYKDTPQGEAYAKQAGPEFSKLASSPATTAPAAKGPVSSVTPGKPGQPAGTEVTPGLTLSSPIGVPSSLPKPAAPTTSSNPNPEPTEEAPASTSGLAISSPIANGTSVGPKPAAKATTASVKRLPRSPAKIPS